MSEFFLTISPDLFLFDVFAVAIVAWLVGMGIYQMSQKQLSRGPFAFEKVSATPFNYYDLIGIGVVVLIYSTNVWVPLLVDRSSLENSSSGDVSASLMVIIMLVGIAVQFIVPCAVLTFILSRRIDPQEAFGLRDVKWPQVLAYTFFAMLAAIAIIMLLSALDYEQWLTSVFGEMPPQDAVGALKNAESPAMLILLIVTAVIIAPVCEEILFRGFLYTITKKFTGPIFSVIVTSIIFSAIHGSVLALFPLFIIGALLAIVYELSGSLWTPILFHAVFNLFNVVSMLGGFN